MSQTEIYWFDDEASNGGVRVPASWKLLYKDGEEWKPVETSGSVRHHEGHLEQGHVQAGDDELRCDWSW